MRIMVLHSRYRSAAPSGENRVVDQEVAALRAAGHQVELFECHSDAIERWSRWQRATLAVTSVRNREVRRELERRLGVSRPHVVHVHNTFPMLSASVLHACRDAHVPVVATIHNYKLLCASGDFFRDGAICHACAGGAVSPAVLHGCYRGSSAATLPVVAGLRVNRAAWRGLVSAYVFVSAAQRDLMRALGLPEERVFVKHNFVPSGFGPATERRHRIAYVGRLDEAKGVPGLMAGWDEYRRRHPSSKLRLAIVGGGPLADRVRRWATTHPSVDVHGLLPPDRARDVIAESLAVVVPSAWEETFGLVAVEAMAAGVAPLAPACGSFPELVTNRRDGVLFEPDSAEALARLMDEVDAEPDRFREYGRAGMVTRRTRFAQDGNITRLLDIYRYAVEHPVWAATPPGQAVGTGEPAVEGRIA